MDEWYMWNAFFTTGNVLDYLRYKSIQDTKDLGADTILREKPMKFQTMGLIVKEQNIGEQDKLVHALTATNGIINAFLSVALKILKIKSVRLPPYSHTPDLPCIKVGRVT